MHVGWRQTKSGTRHSQWSRLLHWVKDDRTTLCKYSTPWFITYRPGGAEMARCQRCSELVAKKGLDQTANVR